MSIRNIGFAPVTTNNVSDATTIVKDGSSITSRYLVWNSDSGSDVHKSFEFQVTFTGILKGKSIENKSTQTYTAKIPVAQCNEHISDYGSGVYWGIGLNQITGLLSALSTDTGVNITFGKRKYDYVKLNVSIRANYIQDWGWGIDDGVNSVWENAQLEIVYVPQLTVDKVFYEESDLIVINYSTPGWFRDDDRWGLDYVRDGSKQFYYATEYLNDPDNTWGNITKQGRIELSTSLFNTNIMNKSIQLLLRIVPFWYPPVEHHSYASTRAVLTVANGTVVNTPTITKVTSSEPTWFEFKVGDSGDKGVPIEQITVKMDGGMYQCDQITVTKQSDGTFPHAVFKYAPFNTPVSFTAIGGSGKKVSAGKSIGSYTLSNRNKTVFDSLVNGTHVDLVDDVQTSIEDKNNQTLIQMAGKRRPSAFYGAGGTTDLTFSAVMLYDDANEFLALAHSNETLVGDVMVRLPDGKRYAIAVSSAKANWTLRNKKEVSISGTEVNA